MLNKSEKVIINPEFEEVSAYAEKLKEAIAIYKSINQRKKMKDENLENSVITLHAKGWHRRLQDGDSADVPPGLYQTRYYVIPPPGINPLKPKRQSKLDPYRDLLQNYWRSTVISRSGVYEHLRKRL
jgi:hypothetical protein